jgi:hypothetical protein
MNAVGLFFDKTEYHIVSQNSQLKRIDLVYSLM